MLLWPLLALSLTFVVLAATRGLAVRRNGSHVVAQLTVGGRGVYFSRTPDGSWWRLRLRRCQGVCEDRGGWGEPPPDSGVREPRRPPGPGPLAGLAELDPPRA